jgi:hypothetical protein
MATERKVRVLPGVTIVGHGTLQDDDAGHPAGTDFVLIQADCVDEARLACEELAPIAQIPEDAWHGSWAPKRVNGQYVLERKIFPTLELLST